MNGGYFLLDCSGLDLTKDTATVLDVVPFN